ncbi:MAG: thiamine phosphate synthase [Thermoanaerobaculia bacterium]
MDGSRLPAIYAITDRSRSGGRDHAEIAERLFRVGVRLVQIRGKDLPDRDLLAAADRALAAARRHGARVVVNDRPDVAALAGAGVHLGRKDLPAAAARPLLAPGALLGVSAHNEEEAARAFRSDAPDYVAFGPVFTSATKTVREARGLDALARVATVKNRPLVAIGGIHPENLRSVLEAGADSVAMVGALMEGGRLEENARRALDEARRARLTGRIYLVGFMGSGKTVVGRRVAERLQVPFVDLDEEIERTSGLTVRALFEASGEEEFRRRESAFLQGTEAIPFAVVATGGGSFARPENQDRLRRLGATVFLDPPFATIRNRMADKTDRPLFKTAQQAELLYREREPFYKMAARRVELTGAESIEEASDAVLAAVYDDRSSEIQTNL